MRLLWLAVVPSMATPGSALIPLDTSNAPVELSTALQAAGLERPEEALAVLRKLALPTLVDLQLLDVEEAAELRGELKRAAVALGDRARLRVRLWQPSFHLHDLEAFDPKGRTRTNPERVPRQLQQPEQAKESKDDASLSGDTIALMLTALLGIGSFVLQARVSKAADLNQREIETASELAGKEKAHAATQLERVRSQMGECLRPMDAPLGVAIELKSSLDFELELPCAEVWSAALGGPVYPFAMYPFVEMHISAFTAAMMGYFTGSGVTQYSPADIEALQADPAKQARFCEVHADCIVPCYQAVANLYVRFKHLIDSEAPWKFPMVKMLGGNGFDMETAMGGNVALILNRFAAFAHAWTPLIRRWEAGDHSILQPPKDPNYLFAMYFSMVAMTLSVGTQEQELMGASSIAGAVATVAVATAAAVAGAVAAGDDT
jgi:hypothetical protein